MVTNARLLKFYKKLRNVPLLGFIGKRLLYDRLILIYDVASTFLHCKHETIEIGKDLSI